MTGTATRASSWVSRRKATVLRVVLALGVALPANAQTLIRVSSAGYPVQNAEVIAWDSGGRIAAGRTDVLGAAHLTPTRVPSTDAFLIVRRLGFVPARVAFVGGDSIAISLIATPTTLPALSTSSKALTFHSYHDMTGLGQSGEATILGFCARQRDQAEIEGELLIAPDGLFRSARWFYRVPHDDEDAGGEATFTQTTFEGRQYLVAVRGSSWRRAGKNLYNQERYERFGWRLGHTDAEARIARPSQWSQP